MMSLVLYLWYEYYEKSCFELICFRSEVQISGTKLVKLDVVVTLILIIGFSYHFWRIIVLVNWHKWFDVQSELDQSRVFYVKEHQRLMSTGFGRGYDFDMNRRRLHQGEYKMANLEKLEQMQDAKEERFDELHKFLGKQYCHGLEPSIVGFKRCVAHLLLE